MYNMSYIILEQCLATVITDVEHMKNEEKRMEDKKKKKDELKTEQKSEV